MADIDVCLARLRSRYPDLSEGQVKEMLQDLDAFRGDDFYSKAKKYRDSRVQMTRAQAAEKLASLQKRKEILDWADRNFDLSNPEEAQEVFVALMAGLDRGVEGGNYSIHNVRRNLHGRYHNMLLKMGKENIDLLASGELDEKVSAVMDLLNRGKDISHIKGPERDIAVALRAFNKAILEDARATGLSVNERMDYIARQSHDFSKMKDKNEWIDFIDNMLDHDETFGLANAKDVEFRRKELGDIFDKIKAGEYERGIGRFGGSRSLHFKDGPSFAIYNKKYGTGSLLDAMSSSADAASKHIAASKILGPNPRETLKVLEKKIADSITDPTAKAEFMNERIQGSKSVRKNVELEVLGYPNHPGQSIGAKTLKTLATIQSTTKLGLAVFSTITDTAFSSMYLRASTGSNMLGAEFKVLKNFMAVASPAQREKWGKLLDLNLMDTIAENAERFGLNTNGINKGAFNKTANALMTATGLPWQNATAKIGNARMFAGHLADIADKGFDQLNERMRASLSRYGIDSKKWDVIRTAVEEVDGAKFITPEFVRNLSNVPSGMSKDDLAMRLSTYLGDSSYVGSPEAGPLEKALINQGLSPDDPAGAALRLAFQFKSFTLAVPRVLRRITMADPNSSSRGLLDVLNVFTPEGIQEFRNRPQNLTLLAATMAEVTALATISNMVKQAIKGEAPQMSMETVMDGFARGALPLSATYMVDTLRGEYDTYGASILSDLVGPTFGQIPDVAKLGSSATSDVLRLIRGEVPMDSKTGIRATRIIMNNTPGINLPFVKTVLHKAFLTEWFEMMNPGWEYRQIARDASKGKKYLFNPR